VWFVIPRVVIETPHSQTHTEIRHLMVSPSSDAEPANIRASMG